MEYMYFSPGNYQSSPQNGDAYDSNWIQDRISNRYYEALYKKQLMNSSTRKLTALNSYKNRKDAQISSLQSKIDQIVAEKQSYISSRITNILNDEKSIRQVLIEIKARNHQDSFLLDTARLYNYINEKTKDSLEIRKNFTNDFINYISDRISQFEDGRAAVLNDFIDYDTEATLICENIKSILFAKTSIKDHISRATTKKMYLQKEYDLYTELVNSRYINFIQSKIGRLDFVVNILFGQRLNEITQEISNLDPNSETYATDLANLEGEFSLKTAAVSQIQPVLDQLIIQLDEINTEFSAAANSFVITNQELDNEISAYQNSYGEIYSIWVDYSNLFSDPNTEFYQWLVNTCKVVPGVFLETILYEGAQRNNTETYNSIFQKYVYSNHSRTAELEVDYFYNNEADQSLTSILGVARKRGNISMFDETFADCCNRLITVSSQIAETQNEISSLSAEITLLESQINQNISTFNSTFSDFDNNTVSSTGLSIVSIESFLDGSWQNVYSQYTTDLANLATDYVSYKRQYDQLVAKQPKLNERVSILDYYKSECQSYISQYPAWRQLEVTELDNEKENLLNQVEGRVQYLIPKYRSQKYYEQYVAIATDYSYMLNRLELKYQQVWDQGVFGNPNGGISVETLVPRDWYNVL